MYRKVLKIVGSRSYTMTTQVGPLQPEKFVQVLPIIKPSQLFPSGKILLCKWKAGDYEGRYTGIIKQLSLSDPNAGLPKPTVCSATLQNFARKILPIEIMEYVSETRIKLQGILGFDGPPESLEYVFVADVESIVFIKHEPFSNNYPHDFNWFDLDQIPYKEMPADDEVWYKHVLDGHKIRGFFNFCGVKERTIKSYQLEKVDNLDVE